jgi:hypothetical protein
MSAIVKVDDGSHQHRQQASEKHQGTKLWEVGHPTLQQRLWGFRRADSSLSHRAAGSLGGTRASDVAGVDAGKIETFQQGG